MYRLGEIAGNWSEQDQYIKVYANAKDPGARRDLNSGWGKPGQNTVRYVKDVPNPKYKAPAPAPAPAPTPAPAPPPPPVVEKPKVAFDSGSYASSAGQSDSASSPGGGPASPFQVTPPKEERWQPFVADTEARNYDNFVKGLDKIKTPEATGSESSSGSGGGGMRFAASQKFRDGINDRLGIKELMKDNGEDDDDAYSLRRNRSLFAAYD